MELIDFVFLGLLPGVVAGACGSIGFRWQLLRFLPALLFIAVAVIVVLYSGNNWVFGSSSRTLTAMFVGIPLAIGYLIGVAAAWLMRFILSLNR